MSDEEEDELEDQLPDLTELALKKKNTPCFQVSGWDNDDEGIEEETNPHENAEKELLWAAEHGRLDVVNKLLIQDSTLVRVRDKDGYTPLHRACYNDHVDIVKALLKAGARHDAETNDQWQPLHSASRWNNVNCAAVLLSHGADINAASQGGVTPLHLAAGHKDGKDLIELFLSHPELVRNAVNTSGDTPTDIARRSGRNSPLFEIIEPCFL